MKRQQQAASKDGPINGVRDAGAPARLSDINAFARRLQSDPAVARNFFRDAGILGEDGELTSAYRTMR